MKYTRIYNIYDLKELKAKNESLEDLFMNVIYESGEIEEI